MNKSDNSQLSGLEAILEQERKYRDEKTQLTSKFKAETSDKKATLQDEINKIKDKLSKLENLVIPTSNVTEKNLSPEAEKSIREMYNANKSSASTFLDQYLS